MSTTAQLTRARARWMRVLRYFGLAPCWYRLYPGRVVDLAGPRENFTQIFGAGITLREWSGKPTQAPSLDALNMTMSNVFGTWRRLDVWGEWAWV